MGLLGFRVGMEVGFAGWNYSFWVWGLVPNSADLTALGFDPDLEDLHTVMIRNIPCRCSAEEVLRAVDSLGFAGTYDFFYLPMNRRHKQGIGYGFINFIELGTAVRFKDATWGYRFPGRRSTKQVEIAVAQLQGRAEVEAYFSCTQVVHTRFRPLM